MSSGFLDWGVASTTRAGETVSGDRFLVHPTPAGVLLAVVDGGGHGPEAARAAERATEILEQCASQPLADALRLCHQALGGTRGAVLLAASYDAGDASLSWAGVGDAFGVLVRADASMRPVREVLLPRSGILGVSVPALTHSLLAVKDGDLLVLATDGVRDDFVGEPRPGEDPHRVSARILERHGKGHDDALVLAARFRVPGR